MTKLENIYEELTRDESIIRGYFKLGCNINYNGSNKTLQQIANDVTMPKSSIEAAIKSLTEKGLI